MSAKKAKATLLPFRRILIFSDVHIPFHAKKAWKLLLKVVALGWDEIVINGDFADCLSVSFHPRNPQRRYRLHLEIAAINKCLDELQAAAGDAKITYIGGNHEYRLDRYIAEKAPELYGLQGTTFPDLLSLDDRGIAWIPYKAPAYQIGKLSIVHDIGRAGINTARQSLVDFGGNLVVGHSHRLGAAYQGTVRGESHVCVNGGWLGEAKDADYMYQDRAVRDWQLGFTTAAVERVGGNCHVTPHAIVANRVFVRDTLVTL